MDESKDQETVVTTIVATTEAVVGKVIVEGVVGSEERVDVSEKVFVQEEVDGGVYDGGDVFVELLGSEVFVDGVRRVSGEMGTVEFGGERGDVDGGGVDASAVRGAEDLESGPRDECVVTESSLLGNGETQVSEACGNVVKEKIVEAVVEVAGNGNETVEVESKDIVDGVYDSVSGVSPSIDEKAHLSAEWSVETEAGGVEDRSTFALESGLSKRDILKVGDVVGVEEAGAQSPGNKVLDGAVNGSVESDEAQKIVVKTICVEYVEGSSEKLSTLRPDKEVPAEEAQVVRMDIDAAADTNFDENTKPSDFARSDFVDELMVESDHKVENMDEKLNMGSTMLETEVPHVSNTCSLPADVVTGPEQGVNKESEGHASHDQLSLPGESDIGKCVVPEPECESDTSLIGCLDKIATDAVAQIGSNKEDNQEVREAVHKEQVCSYTNAILGPDAHVVSMNASPNEDKSANLSNHEIFTADDVPQAGLNVKDVQDVQEEALVSDKALSMDNLPIEDETNMVFDHASSAAQIGSNVDHINAEQAVSVVNAAPGEDETSNLPNPVASASADNQGQIYMADEDLDLSPPLAETAVPDVSASNAEAVQDSGPMHGGNGRFEVYAAHELSSCPVQSRGKGDGQRLEQRTTDYVVEVDSNMEDIQEVSNHAVDSGQANSPEEQVVDEEHVSDSAKSRNKERKNSKRSSSKSGSLLKDHCVSYQLPLDDEGDFSVSDLVWGKVKSHPWWPGQIFHSSNSSEKAMKYYKKDCYLVAYFGDRTFAWNEASVLKPFREHFSLAERQNNTEAFKNAVKCALAEVSRRTELGLACSCISEEAYDKIKYQIVENTGIREESSKREGVDRCTGADHFQPDKLVEYMRSLAVFPTSNVDRLDLTIVKAQLLASHRLKGVDALADFEYYEGLKECDFDMHTADKWISGEVGNEGSVTRAEANTILKGPKRKHNLKDIVYQRRKEKSMTELMGETMYYLDGEFDSQEEDDNLLTSTSGVKRKAGFLTDDFTSQQNTKTISLAKVSHTASSNAQQSFRVGECISRVASQLTGSPLIMKAGNDGSNNQDIGDDSGEVSRGLDDSETEMSQSPSQQSSLDEMLSQLCLSAQAPMKGYSFLGNICSFFAEFRNFAVSTQRQKLRKKGGSRKRKSSAPVVRPPETFEFEERNDSYWTDMVVQNNAEAKAPRRARKRKNEQFVSAGADKPPQSTPRKSRKTYSYGTPGSAAEVPSVDQKQQDQLPTELMLSFVEMSSIPSEVNLNRMFRRFGTLRESDTEVDMESNRARVVFKKRSDAEVAYSSAAMFNIFGSTLVNYQLNYTPSVSIRTAPLPLTGVQEGTI